MTEVSLTGSLPLDLLIDSMRTFVDENPVEREETTCPVCDKPESETPAIFIDGLGCCDLCRKVHRGELSNREAAQIQDNLTNNSG